MLALIRCGVTAMRRHLPRCAGQVACGAAAGAALWRVDGRGPLWLAVIVCTAVMAVAVRVERGTHRALTRWAAATACPHPLHRIRHVHGDERHHRDAAVAQCMECRIYFQDWPGGRHDATRCWTG